MRKIAPRLQTIVWGAVLPMLLSCNVYKPLSSPGTDEEYRQAALACLHQGDYTCAVDNYNKLSDTVERDQNLCEVEMAQAGMTLDALVNVISEKTTGTQLFGAVANQLLPYTTDKGTAAADARTKCATLPLSGSHAKLNVLLQSLSYIADCASRMSATSVVQCTSSSTTVAGTGHSTVLAADISATDGTYASSGKAMCDTDANQCALDYYNAFAVLTSLQNNGFDQVANNLNSLRGPFTTLFGAGSPAQDAAGAILAREFIRQSTTN